LQLGSATTDTEQFMAVAAHDLRNPIAVVRASAQMAQRQLGRGDMGLAQGRLTAIIEQADRVTEILETFVDAARIKAGHLGLRTERLDMADVLAMATDHLNVSVGDLAARDVQRRVTAGCVGVWDRPRVVRALRALISNALLYGNPSAPVDVEVRREEGAVVVRVSGGGSGPDAEERKHLFEPFFRGRSAAEAGQSGSGLGLFTARGIAREHAGDVRHVKADVFELQLPLSD
jgi:signal transduction histidine kinase